MAGGLVKFLRAYDIDIIRLKDGLHTFEFEISNSFVEFYQAEAWLNGAALTVTVILKKTVSVLEVQFEIVGTVRLTCDRSLEEFDFPLEIEEQVIYKYGPIEQEISEDIFMITRDTPKINVAQLIYEFIVLAIPAKKIHPDYVEEMDEEDFEAEGTIVYLSSEEEELAKPEEEKENKPIDPRWEVLNKLKQKE